MEVSKQNFDSLKSLIGPTSEFPEQSKIINQINFELDHDCDIFFGKYFPDHLWMNPDREVVFHFFEETKDDPEERISQYESNPVLSESELEEFKEHWRTEIGTNGDIPGTVIGFITHENERLVVFTERVGYSFEGIEIDLVGIFESEEQGVTVLYPEGEMLD